MSAEAAEATFAHPQGDREITLGAHRIRYVFKRARRRSVGFMVGAEGLVVSAPMWLRWHDVEDGLRHKAKWIVSKLQLQRARAEQARASIGKWAHGAVVPYLGRDLTIALNDKDDMCCDADDALPSRPAPCNLQTTADRLTLHIDLPRNAATAEVCHAVQAWFKQQACTLFASRCAHFASALGVQAKRISLSSARTRWGSASSNGSIRLNWRLVHLPMACIDYVCVHELAHLREMNHSQRFWQVVRSALPEFEAARAEVKKASALLLSDDV